MTDFGNEFSAERMTEEFMRVLCQIDDDGLRYQPHVRKVGPWLGFMIRGIDNIKSDWWIPRSRQLHFESSGRRFKAKFDHSDGGGIDIIEIATSPGSEEIGLVYRARCLADAERFYLLPHLSAARRPAAA
jgi:hypothetical protein